MAEETRPEWMTSISATIDPEEYLLGRKIDKTFELSQQEKADKAREVRIDLLSKDRIKLTGDPILDLERRRREIKMEVIRNPVLLKQLRDKLLREEREKAGETSQKPSEKKKHVLQEEERSRGTKKSARHTSPNTVHRQSTSSSTRREYETYNRDKDSRRGSERHRHSRDEHSSEIARTHDHRSSQSEKILLEPKLARDNYDSRHRHHEHKRGYQRDISRSKSPKRHQNRDHHSHRSKTHLKSPSDHRLSRPSER